MTKEEMKIILKAAMENCRWWDKCLSLLNYGDPTIYIDGGYATKEGDEEFIELRIQEIALLGEVFSLFKGGWVFYDWHGNQLTYEHQEDIFDLLRRLVNEIIQANDDKCLRCGETVETLYYSGPRMEQWIGSAPLDEEAKRFTASFGELDDYDICPCYSK